MAQFEPLKHTIESLGASLVFIAAERRGGFMSPESFLAKNEVPFPLLLDEDRTVTKAYGVYHAIGFDAFNIAHPAAFVIDSSGIVRYIYVGSSQTDRAPIEQLLSALEDVSPAQGKRYNRR
jgi:peroxiredoxin